jgi:FHS family L-fucose permease-like MFS transporter
VAANPYVTLLGPAETASARLTLTQAFNSLGTTIAPVFGALLILGVSDGGESALAEARAVEVPYVFLASTLLLLAAVFVALKLPVFQARADQPASTATYMQALRHRNLLLGALAIFVYVGAEVAIGSVLVNFIGLPEITGLKEAQAAHYVSLYWGGAMLGRFIGAALMRRISPALILAVNATMAVALISVAVSASGLVAMWAILLVGLCNSIMFPAIFSLGLHRLGIHTSHGSGLMCLAIVGGAIIPLLQGMAADAIGLQQSLLLPVICYAYIAFFGIWCKRRLAI